MCKPGEKSALSDTQNFQLLTNHFKPDVDSKVPLAYQEVKNSGRAGRSDSSCLGAKNTPAASVFTITKGLFLTYCAIYAHSNKSTLEVLVKILLTKFSRAKGKDGILTTHS